MHILDCEDESPSYNQIENVRVSAYLTTETHLRAGDVVKFDQVHINQGNAYRSSDGVFTCPLSGTYFLDWTFANPNKGSASWLQVVINGTTFSKFMPVQSVARLVFRSSHILNLERGEQVTTVAEEDMTLYGDSSKSIAFSVLYLPH